MTVRLLRGDCTEVLQSLAAESVHCCVTSPPYFGLRNYDIPPTSWPAVEFVPVAGVPSMTIPPMSCCLGLEPDPWAFVGHMVLLARHLARVLRPDGTLWLNIGDSYASAGGQSPQMGKLFKGRTRQRENICISSRVCADGVKNKDMLGIPWRLAFALQADGWYLRQDIVWSKPNPMPESVRDRCTKAHEYIFLLSKSPRYYFDLASFEEPRVSQHDAGIGGWASGDTPHDAIAHNRDKGNAKTFRGGQYTNGAKFNNSHATERDSHGNAPPQKSTRNRRSVWNIATAPFGDAHFATFPPALVEPCILAGCPVGGTVLDPFFGSGTTGMVAERLMRNCIGIDLNDDYAAMAERRIRADAPLFNEVTA